MVAGRDPDQVYETDAAVLENVYHGPELCWRLRMSHPPQCRGIPIRGWDWDGLPRNEAAGTTWGSYHVTGTYDGHVFTVTAPPGPLRPQPAPPTGGPRPPESRITSKELVAANDEAEPAGVHIVTGEIDADTGAVAVTVVIDDDLSRRWVEERFGPDVAVTGLLRPVSEMPRQ